MKKEPIQAGDAPAQRVGVAALKAAKPSGEGALQALLAFDLAALARAQQKDFGCDVAARERLITAVLAAANLAPESMLPELVASAFAAADALVAEGDEELADLSEQLMRLRQTRLRSTRVAATVCRLA